MASLICPPTGSIIYPPRIVNCKLLSVNDVHVHNSETDLSLFSIQLNSHNFKVLKL